MYPACVRGCVSCCCLLVSYVRGREGRRGEGIERGERGGRGEGREGRGIVRFLSRGLDA